MNAKFQLDEVVRVNAMLEHAVPVAGRQGVVLGMAQDDGGLWSYAVDMGSSMWVFGEEELEWTGRREPQVEHDKAA